MAIDNCKGCRLRGNLDGCLKAECSFHDDWIVKALLDVIKDADEGLEEWNRYDKEYHTAVHCELDAVLVDHAQRVTGSVVSALKGK